MRKIKPAFSEADWSIEFTCVGEIESPGCGAVLEVTMDDLYLVDTSRPWAMTIGPTLFPMFTCPCGLEHRAPYLRGVTNLPTKKQWSDRHSSPSQS